MQTTDPDNGLSIANNIAVGGSQSQLETAAVLPMSGEPVIFSAGLGQSSATASSPGGGSKAARSSVLGCFMPGDLVGGSYEVIDLIGKGGMGCVYTARHINMPAIYALKVLITKEVTDNKVMRFQNEAQAIAKLNHPNIIAIYNFGLHEGTLPFYVMDLLEGKNLYDILMRDGPAPVSAALPLFIEVCAGLGHAHRKGILHRDVKPANIVKLNEPDARGARVKLVDFGIVKFAEEIKPDAQKLTAMGAVCGSPSYMSPEQASGERTDPRSDIYSVGCSLFQIFTGKVPFHGRNATETMLMHCETAAPTLASMGQGRTYSEDLELLIAKMLAKEPMDRYQTMDSVGQDLRNILDGKPLGTPQTLQARSESSAVRINSARLQQKPMENSTRATTYDINLSHRFLPAHGAVKTGDVDVSMSIKARRSHAGLPEIGGNTSHGTTDDGTTGDSTGNFTTRERKIASQLAVHKMWIVATLVVGLISAIGFFVWQTLHTSKQAHSPAARSMDAAAGVAPNILERPVLQPGDMGDSTGMESSEPIVLTSDKYFAKATSANGRQFLEFNFPVQRKGEAVAWIGTKISDSQRTEGKVMIARGAPVYIMPTRIARRLPQFFDKFRLGEIQGVVLGSQTDSDELFLDVCKIPGISLMLLAGCPQLTNKIMPTLGKLELKVFYASGLTISGEQLAKAKFWQNLTKLTLNKDKDITPVLKKIGSSKKLETLALTDTNLNGVDYQLIAKLPNLKELNISRNKLTVSDLKALSRLRSLTTMCVVDVKISSYELAEQVKSFPALRNLVVNKRYFRSDEVQKLKRECPHLRIVEISALQARQASRNAMTDSW